MAFPSVRSSNTTNGTSASATPVVNLPATIRAGDTIFVIFRSAVVGAVSWPDATWNELFDGSPDGSDDQFAAAWRKADGTEGSTITLGSGNGKFGAIALAVKDAADPSIRPPELSTVATGTTGQPNATTCTPTGGAKDYLWYTFVGQEGEQTGITSYPTNYTTNQSGLVNSGTGGLPATNVTLQGASRQANAASEDAGAWTIAGTLSNWSAYTIAFHPASPVDAGLDRQAASFFEQVKPLAKPSNSLVALTIAVNLLQGTLAPPDQGYSSQEVLISSRPSARLSELTILNNLLQTTLAPALAAPFNQTDWPNPQLKKVPFPQLLNTFQKDDSDLAFVPVIYVTPSRKEYRLTWLNNNLNDVLAPITGAPFIPEDFPNPGINKKQNLGFANSRPQYYTDIKPFINDTYPNPQYKGKQNVGFVSARPSYYSEPIASSSPCLISLGIGPGDITCFVLTGLEANPMSLNRDNIFLPVPAPKRNLALTWTQSRPLSYYVDDFPITKRIIDIPVLKTKKANLGFITSRPTYYVEPSAVPLNKNIQWPNPAPRRKYSAGWLDYYLLDATTVTTTAAPTYQHDVLIPGKRPLRSYLGWIDYRIFDTNVPTQPTQLINSVPIRRKFVPQGHVVNSLTASAVVSQPVGKQTYTNPSIKKISALSHLQTSLSVTDVPTFQNDWPNPKTIKANVSWIQNRPFFFEELLPIVESDYPNPLIIKKANVGYIFNQQITEVNPIVNYDLTVPGRKIRGTEGVLVNLLQSTLTPAVGDVPFYQTDYPNPSLGKRGQGWIWTGTIYYPIDTPFISYLYPNPKIKKGQELGWIYRNVQSESPNSGIITDNPRIRRQRVDGWIVNLQEGTLNPIPFTSLNQKDWPNPIIGRKNQVGFNYSIVHLFESGAPFVSTIFEVPVRGKFAPQIAFIRFAGLTEPQGNPPFSQYDWPIFRLVKRPTPDILNRAFILSQIEGRSICLLADDTEYYLEATDEIYDLDARMTEYDLEAGGKDCE